MPAKKTPQKAGGFEEKVRKVFFKRYGVDNGEYLAKKISALALKMAHKALENGIMFVIDDRKGHLTKSQADFARKLIPVLRDQYWEALERAFGGRKDE